MDGCPIPDVAAALGINLNTAWSAPAFVMGAAAGVTVGRSIAPAFVPTVHATSMAAEPMATPRPTDSPAVTEVVTAQAYLAWAFERLGTRRDIFGLRLDEMTPSAFKNAIGP